MESDLIISYVCSISLGLIIVFGVSGNVLSLIIWSRGRQCRLMSCGCYFRLLAMADIFNLVVSGTVMMLEISPAHIVVYDYSIFFCKMIPFSAHFGVQLSSWICVCVTIERTLSIRFPLKFYTNKTKHHAYGSFCLIILGALILDFVPLLFNKIEPVTERNMLNEISENRSENFNSSLSGNITRERCVLPEAYTTLDRVWTIYVSFGCFVVGLPPIFITGCNILTLITLRRQLRMEYEYQNKRCYKTTISFTYLVILISVIHCISTIPVGYLYIQYDYFNVQSSPVFYRVALILFYLNSGTNVVFYCLIGRTFREDLICLLRSCGLYSHKGQCGIADIEL